MKKRGIKTEVIRKATKEAILFIATKYDARIAALVFGMSVQRIYQVLKEKELSTDEA